MKKVTEPMRIILLNAQKNDGKVSWSYPRGQMRLIIQGLYRRGLITDPKGHWELTKDGWDYR